MARLCALVFITNAAAWTAPRRPAPLRGRCTALRVAKRGDRAKKKVKLKDKIISEPRPASTGRRVEDAHSRTWIDGAEAAWLAAEGGDAAGAFADGQTDASYGDWLRLSSPRATVPKPNFQPDFNVSVFECFDTISSAGLRELDESDRSVQKSAESTSI